MGVEALEGGQQGRVDIQHASLPMPDEVGAEQTHETGKTYNFDAVLIERRLQGPLETRAILAELRVFDDLGGNARRVCHE